MMTVAGIAVAGALGAVARYGLDSWIGRHQAGTFPWGTFAVNISGAFALGVLFELFTARIDVASPVRIGLTTGFLGAYTTFSTLSLETVRLIQHGAYVVAVANSLGSLVLGLLAAWAGMAAGRALA
ncbi:MAG TPA: fluoride efflux transporter CrcB [Actinomycetota bacterium]|nr:fluoride efflux transporter CrcB [Actinomycetota bacterium]